MSCNSHIKRLWEDWNFSFIYRDEEDVAIDLDGYLYSFKIVDIDGNSLYSTNWTATPGDDEIIIKVAWWDTAWYAEGQCRFQWKVTSPDWYIDLTDIWEFGAEKSLFSS